MRLSDADDTLGIDMGLGTAGCGTGDNRTVVGHDMEVILKGKTTAASTLVHIRSVSIERRCTRGLPVHAIKHNHDDVVVALIDGIFLQLVKICLIEIRRL